MKASLRNTRISPKKMNLVAELVRGENALKAEQFLSFTPKKGAKILKKVIASARANATNNFKQNANELYIKEIVVSKAFTLKRYIPGSRGRARPIEKKASHVHVILDVQPVETVTPKSTNKSKEKTKQ